MPSVAVDYGIKQEDRFDFIIATDTALQLLQHLYIQFGHWDLAFAAYHAGSGQVQKALQQNPMATSIEELRLPQTTKNYVKKLMLLNQTMMDMMVDDA
jgi:membrane-bound lytic murein transglycosylase D